MSEEMITISKQEYDELLESDRILSGLYAAGVDNWEGYGMFDMGDMEDE